MCVGEGFCFGLGFVLFFFPLLFFFFSFLCLGKGGEGQKTDINLSYIRLSSHTRRNKKNIVQKEEKEKGGNTVRLRF